MFERYRLPLLLTLYLALTLPFCFLGYGSDNDSYQVVGAGKFMWEQHRLVTSRLPGYWTFEAVVYLLNRLGGSLLVNLGSLLMGAGILWRLDALRRRLPHAALTTSSLFLIFVPTFQIAASSCDDYLWSLLPMLLAFEALLDRRALQTGLWGALAVAVRPTNVVVLFGLFAGSAVAKLWSSASRHGDESAERGGDHADRLFGAVAVSLIGLLPLCLSYFSFGNSFAFLHETSAQSAVSTLKMYVGRFGYKILMALGPVTFVVITVGCFLLRRRFCWIRQVPGVALPCLGLVVMNVALFARFPLEISYLLPAILFFLILLACTVLSESRWLRLGIGAALVFSNICTLTLAKPDVQDHASGAKFGFGLESGPVVQDQRARRMLMGCDSLDCWRARTGK